MTLLCGKQALSSKALGDKEEWVSTMGRALSPLDGRAHVDAVIKGQAAVGPLPLPAFALYPSEHGSH